MTNDSVATTPSHTVHDQHSFIMPAQASPGQSDPVRTDIRQPLTLTTLPPEIRLEIYDWVFFSTTLKAAECETFGYEIFKDGTRSASKREWESHDAVDWVIEIPITPVPVMMEKLNLVCRLLNSEIGQT